MTASILAELRTRTLQMIDDLAQVVAVESPSDDTTATAACADTVADLGERLLGSEADPVSADGRTHLTWRFGDRAEVVLIGHLDTVWPVGTLARWPFQIEGDIATGPGCFDMKAGVVQLLHALSVIDDREGVTVLLTTDEEIGSPSSRDLIQRTVTGARAALVLEPSQEGALKTERKGSARYVVKVGGVAAHAGLDPERGANATHEAAHQTITIADLGNAELGTTVTPTVLRAGTSANTVPAEASLYVDVRARTVDEQERVDAALGSLTPVLRDTSVDVERLGMAPPLMHSASEELFAVAERVAEKLGLPPLEEAASGGASDGNFTASIGVPTLDGLGPVGAGAHAEGEHVVVSAMAERAALVAGLILELRGSKR